MRKLIAARAEGDARAEEARGEAAGHGRKADEYDGTVRGGAEKAQGPHVRGRQLRVAAADDERTLGPRRWPGRLRASGVHRATAGSCAASDCSTTGGLRRQLWTASSGHSIRSRCNRQLCTSSGCSSRRSTSKRNPVSEEKREKGEHVLERKTTKPDELQKLTLALRDFERRLKRRRPEHLKAKLQKLADELQKHKDERKRRQLHLGTQARMRRTPAKEETQMFR